MRAAGSVEQGAERRIFAFSAASCLAAAVVVATAAGPREALALTAGGAVAIVSAVWLSDVVGRLLVPQPYPAGHVNRRFVTRGLLRYLALGCAIFVTLRLFQGEAGWLLGGFSAVVAGVVIEGIWEASRARSVGGKLPGPPAGAGV